MRFGLLGALLLSVSALAQEKKDPTANPDEEWGQLPKSATPSQPPPPAPPPELPPREPLPVGPNNAPPPPPVAAGGLHSGVTKPPEDPNRVSMFGAPTLKQWNRGETAYLGFPVLGIRLGIGLLDFLDVGVGFESFYGVMNEPIGFVKVGLVQSGHWTLAASVEGGYAWFGQKAQNEVHGPRWLTGRRNGNVSPGIIVSYQGDHPRAARLFLEARYLMTFDTEPFARDPLNGVPPSMIIGHNASLHVGAEMPLSPKTSFVFLLGLEGHFRDDDAPVMPVCSLGLVTGL
ncbi:MAG: hypothetical protein QM723_16350 [Myxococcaceae bacterium]